MTREHLLAAKHLAMEEYAYQCAIQSHLINVHVGEIKEPKVEYVSAENSYTEWELQWFGIDTQKQKSGLIAVIPVQGSLAPFWTWGGTNTEWLSRQVEICIGNPLVSGIVLKGMTGGGTVAGTMAAAETVKAANKQKPILGYVTGMVASAGLWLFSPCREIYLESGVSSAIGSLGVISVYVSQHEQLKNEGLDVRVLRSKGSEDKNLLHPADPINEDALAEEQKIIDAMRGEFLSAVKAARPQIVNDPGGKLYYGRDAIRAGLADGIASLSDTIKRADYLARKMISSTL